MPWIFAGRRWVATKELQELRYPETSAVARPVGAGCYLSTYWVTEGRYDDHMKWTVAINRRLNRDGRVYQDRTHVFTAFQDHEATVYRDGRRAPGTSTRSTTRTPVSSSRSSTPKGRGSGRSCWSGCGPVTFRSCWRDHRRRWSRCSGRRPCPVTG